MEIKIEKGDIKPLPTLKCTLVMYLKYNTFVPCPTIQLSKKCQI